MGPSPHRPTDRLTIAAAETKPIGNERLSCMERRLIRPMLPYMCRDYQIGLTVGEIRTIFASSTRLRASLSHFINAASTTSSASCGRNKIQMTFGHFFSCSFSLCSTFSPIFRLCLRHTILVSSEFTQYVHDHYGIVCCVGLGAS